jgi:hypothetical protein
MRAVALRSAFVFIGTIAALTACASSSKTVTGEALSVNITIAHGQVTPANATFQATVRQPITLHVTSDVTDELHVHSVPDHKFEVAAAANQTFQFSVDVPGSVDVELHHLDRTVATIHVNP